MEQDGNSIGPEVYVLTIVFLDKFEYKNVVLLCILKFFGEQIGES